MLVLFPCLLAIHFLEAVLLQHHGQDAGEPAGLVLVALFPGQNDRLGVGVHHVGVLAHDHVHQPLGGALRRAGIALLRCAKVAALFAGRSFVLPEDVQAVARPVLRHRIVLNYEASADSVVVHL